MHNSNDNYNKEKEQEYNRIQHELMSRIKMCYSDGAMLASFMLVYYATVIAGIVQCFQIKNCITSFLLVGLISSVAFFFPIIILYTFAVKFKENFSAVCNISAFSSAYHEKPSIIKTNSIEGTKWEILHKNSLSLSTRYEAKEYFLLALTSFFFLIVGFVGAIWIYTNNLDKIKSLYLIIVMIIFFCFFLIGSIYVYKIYCDTSLIKLGNIMKDTELFYEIQSEKFSLKDNQPCELFDKILAFKKDEEMLNMFLIIKRIPDYKATEIIKLFYGRIKSENYSKEIKSKKGKELIKKAEKCDKSIHDYIIKYVEDYLEKHNL